MSRLVNVALVLGGLYAAKKISDALKKKDEPRVWKSSLDEVPITKETRTPEQIIAQARALVPWGKGEDNVRWGPVVKAINKAERTKSLIDARAALEGAEYARDNTGPWTWRNLPLVGDGL